MGSMKVVIENYESLVKDIHGIKTGAEKAVKRTISDFKSRGPGWISQEIQKEYNIKKKDINKAKHGTNKGSSSIRIAGTGVDDISIIYRGRLLTPTHFGMKPTVRPDKGPYVVRAKIKKSGGNKPLGHKVFLAASGDAGTTQIPFQRRGKARTPVDVIKTVSVPQMVTNDKVAESIHDRMNEELTKRLHHHLEQNIK